MEFMSRFLKISLMVLACILLQGCLNAAFTGAQVVYDRHNLKKKIDDQYITMQAYDILYYQNSSLSNYNIAVSTFHQIVLLTGQVPNQSLKQLAGRKIRSIFGVKHVYNFIRVEPIGSPTVEMYDTWITTKIKTKLIATNDIDPSQIKVITDNGVVYLLGIVPQDQADIAVEIARTTNGVMKVVKIFTYLKECKA